jgi:LysR family carnitine catabolism transcriptional activator
MNVKRLRIFLVVAKTRSFALASDILFQSQPSLSVAIKKLEDELGGRLLDRTTRRVSLTPEGEELYKIGKSLLAAWDSSEEQIKQRFQLKRGRVAIGAMPSFASNLLPEILMSFRTKHPGISVEVHDVIAERVVELVRTGHIEMGLSFASEMGEDLLFTPLFTDEFIAVLPQSCSLAEHMSIQWGELVQHDFITLQRPSSMREHIELELAASDIELNVVYEAHQLVTVGRMVAEGLGVSAVPSLCQRQMQEMGATCTSLKEPVIKRPVGIICRSDHQLSVAAKAMFDECVSYFDDKD